MNKITTTETEVINSINTLTSIAHSIAKDKGWWDEDRNDGELIALMHSELSETLEALRNPDKKDEHLPDHNPVALELADTLIRIFDYCGARNINLGQALVEKMKYNMTRPRKHNKVF